MTLPLLTDILSNEEKYKGRIVPLAIGQNDQSYQFGITSQTPQSLIGQMTRQYNDEGKIIHFYLISGSAFKVFMNRFDPPKKTVYEDIKIAEEGDSETLEAVSKALAGVGSDDVFTYLVTQADKLGASDIHVENQRDGIRIRMRVDGALHQVADISKDRYRVIMATLASHANISTAAADPQSGHMQFDMFDGVTARMLNLRVETVPTIYGQDVVLRLFNFDSICSISIFSTSIQKTASRLTK